MHVDLASAAVWSVALVTLGGILIRPFRSAEWQWAAGGAIALVAMRLTTPEHAWSSVARGADVYAFLIGILLLAEVARAEGVFTALALGAARVTGGSPRRLFALVYLAGVAVTSLLSNDTTVIVLTPAVLAVVEPSGADPMAYLYACAFVANAASFVFPFSNPANLSLLRRAV